MKKIKSSEQKKAENVKRQARRMASRQTTLTDDERRYGFNESSQYAIQIFRYLPIYPTYTTLQEVAKHFGITGKQASDIISRIPPDAPVFYDNQEVGRWK